MAQLPTEELAKILFQEIESYLPQIRRGIDALQKDRSDLHAAQENHRLFHNIKGAASQTGFSGLSSTAEQCENILQSALYTTQTLSPEKLTLLEDAYGQIREFCFLPDGFRSNEDEDYSITDLILTEEAELTDPYTDLFDELEGGCLIDQRQECLTYLRTIPPLLQELTECSAQAGAPQLVTKVLPPLSQAISTLADCSLAAGLPGQHRLLSDFLVVLERLVNSSQQIDHDTLGLLQEFLTYLDILFTLPAHDGERVAATIQDRLTSLTDLLAPPIASDRIFMTTQDMGFFDAMNEQPDSAPYFPDEAHSERPAPPSSTTSEELELLTIFQAECEEHLQVVNVQLNVLEKKVHGSRDLDGELKDTLGKMRRAVHTLKGAAGMTGMTELSSSAHSLEDLLDWLSDEAADIHQADVSLIADSIDSIENLAQEKGDANIAAAYAVSGKIEMYLRARSAASADSQEPKGVKESPADDPPALHPLQKALDTPHEEQHSLPGGSGNVRVKLEDLDELTSIEGELLIARSSIEKHLDRFSRSLHEFNTIKETLQRKSQELEMGFEAQSLYGFGQGPAPDSQTAAQTPALSEFDPIELDRYSQLNLIIRSLNEVSIDVNAVYSEMRSVAGEISGQIARQQLAMSVMQEKLMRIRMTPLSSLSRMLFRTVRQTAANLEKNVQLSIIGEDVYMDRFVWSKILDPLMHILRNCTDHGIEDAHSRQAAGKEPTGRITIDAEQRSRSVIIRIRDDGQGVDMETLREKLIADNIITASDRLSESELIRHILQPGFSTKQDISEISGRGVGLDVVARNLKELRGTVDIKNSPGKGLIFELNIPITLSVNRAIIISVSGNQFAVPIQDIVEVYKVDALKSTQVEAEGIEWKGQKLSAAHLARSLQLPGHASDAAQGNQLALIIEDNGSQQALIVDGVLEQREIVVKDLGSHLKYVRGINGATLTGEGVVIPILNLTELAAGHRSEDAAPQQAAVPEPNSKLTVLIVDDSISVRYSITRLIEAQGWKPFQAVDGIDALEKLETVTPDIIILDVEMPRMNGYELMGALRHSERYASIPVVMLTSRASDKHRKKAEELGANRYITKPYQEESFVDMLKSMTGNE